MNIIEPILIRINRRENQLTSSTDASSLLPFHCTYAGCRVTDSSANYYRLFSIFSSSYYGKCYLFISSWDQWSDGGAGRHLISGWSCRCQLAFKSPSATTHTHLTDRRKAQCCCRRGDTVIIHCPQSCGNSETAPRATSVMHTASANQMAAFCDAAGSSLLISFGWTLEGISSLTSRASNNL